MTEYYVVEVTHIAKPLSPEALERLAQQFTSSPDRLERLIGVLPGIATKEISQAEASLIAGYFNEAGLTAFIKPARLSFTSYQAEKPKSGELIAASLADTGSSPDSPLENVRQAPTKPSEKSFFPEKPMPFTPIKQASSSPFPETRKEPLPLFPASRSGRSARQGGDVFKMTSLPKNLEKSKRDGHKSSLLQKLVLAMLGSVLLASLGVFAMVAYQLWLGLKTQNLQMALLSTVASAASLSRSIEENGDISQFANLASPVPKQSSLSTRLVLTTNISASPFASWPKDAPIEKELEQRIKEQVELAVELNSGSQTELRSSPNPLVSPLIISSYPLEHGSAVVGVVTTVFSYEPMLAYLQLLLSRAALLSLVPLALALLLGFVAMRSLTRHLFQLIQQAEALSKGHLAEPVRVYSNDELKDLSTSLERLRLSTKTSLERLRERRDRGF